ncbi:MAG: hypothetical protein JF603_01200 [Acidobacteria bacterium]|nr:hypothetical protein [Acidobacteriota bacterium]
MAPPSAGEDARASAWPALTLSEWDDTRTLLHLWTQIVGKIRMGLEPMINHWWQVTLYVSARGLTTSLMPAGDRGVEIELDFIDQVLDLRATDGRRQYIPLESGSVAEYYSSILAAMTELGVPVTINPMPSEIVAAISFADDHQHRTYDPDWARRYWTVLRQVDRLLGQFRSEFIGKASPVHYFWGGADLATTRFSGRTAPLHPGGVPNCPDWVQQLAYSHEVHSCGFWPDGSPEGSFYAYAYPAPAGFADWPVKPEAAYFDTAVGEFILPYAAVRTAADPDQAVLDFCRSTYDAAAELAEWDRVALEA